MTESNDQPEILAEIKKQIEEDPTLFMAKYFKGMDDKYGRALAKLETRAKIKKIVIGDKRMGKLESLEIVGEMELDEAIGIIESAQRNIDKTLDSWIKKHKDQPEEAPSPASKKQLNYINDLTTTQERGDVIKMFMTEHNFKKVEDLTQEKASDLIVLLKAF